MHSAPIRLKKIKLENIGCFVRKTLRFSGMSVIFGENRTGKSTLVYAVYFALYGAHLNSNLKVADLCRKGETAGKVTLYFEKAGTAYKLGRTTEALPRLFRRTGPEAPWDPVPLHDPDVLDAVISIPAETASLTSFFRESELIYFLQDMPKYNQTMLQSLIGMDDGIILRSRFKKALSRAREVKKAIESAAPKKRLDPLAVELTRRQLDDAEKALADLDLTLQKIRDPHLPDPTVYKLLSRQHQAGVQNLAALRALAEKLPPQETLAAERETLAFRIREAETAAAGAEELQRRLGAAVQKRDTLRLRLKHLGALENRPACPVCEQEVPPEQITALGRKIESQMAQAEADQTGITAGLEAVRNLREAQALDQKRLLEIERQAQEHRDIEQRIRDVTEQLAVLASDLKPFEQSQGAVHEAEARFGREQAALRQRVDLQEQIIRHRVALKRHEDDGTQADEHQKHIALAERKALVCTVAFRAVEEAIQGLGSRLLEKVRGSVGEWSRHFSFLDRFDIQITDRELLPMIQARGYQYKLNQMSKSERIFLYLMLKLAIGDALGHLGLFMLDDPADGLDLKRKQTLAYLLAEVAGRRQVLVTTNDADFAGMFAGGRRVDLEERGVPEAV
ncbi:ATP-binding protein [Desulfococcus sp.]|uniref:ATP-binding protein n=1 Tax=Desulfococcus sp. TaxID=2025834 RepID=UPI003593CD49